MAYQSRANRMTYSLLLACAAGFAIPSGGEPVIIEHMPLTFVKATREPDTSQKPEKASRAPTKRPDGAIRARLWERGNIRKLSDSKLGWTVGADSRGLVMFKQDGQDIWETFDPAQWEVQPVHESQG